MAQYLVQSAVTLLGVLLLVAVIVFGTRRLAFRPPDPSLEVLARLPLEARRAIYLVRVKERVFVVAANDHAITKLGELAADDFPASELPASGTFSDALRRALSAKSAATPQQGPKT